MMKPQKGVVEMQVLVAVVLITALLFLTPLVWQYQVKETDAEKLNYQVGIIFNAISAYHGVQCKGVFVQPTINTLIAGGYLTANDIADIRPAISSISVSQLATSPTATIVIMKFALGGHLDSLRVLIPGITTGGAYGTYQVSRPLTSVSQTGYGYDSLFNKECGR